MKNLENYLDCQPINDMNIDDGKIKGNILLNQNYSISSCANPGYNSYKSTMLTTKDYTNQELYTSTAINNYAILYAVLIGLFITLFFVNIVINIRDFSRYKKIMIGFITFVISLTTIYTICIYSLTSNYSREIVKQDSITHSSKPKQNKINS
jgi:hypothetical protein